MPVRPAPKIAIGVGWELVAELMPKDGGTYHHLPVLVEPALAADKGRDLQLKNPKNPGDLGHGRGEGEIEPLRRRGRRGEKRRETIWGCAERLGERGEGAAGCEGEIEPLKALRTQRREEEGDDLGVR